jgi:hypothetical protein
MAQAHVANRHKRPSVRTELELFNPSQKKAVSQVSSLLLTLGEMTEEGKTIIV